MASWCLLFKVGLPRPPVRLANITPNMSPGPNPKMP